MCGVVPAPAIKPLGIKNGGKIMENYDYYEAVKADVLDYIRLNISVEDYKDRDSLEEYLNDTLWAEDSVTGNASGSYTFNTYMAEEYLCHNLELLGEAVESFGGNTDILKDGAEACDVTIRCYVLGTCISEALDEIFSELDQ